jgi:hypothetical protein
MPSRSAIAQIKKSVFRRALEALPGHECPGYKGSAGQGGFKEALGGTRRCSWVMRRDQVPEPRCLRGSGDPQEKPE